MTTHLIAIINTVLFGIVSAMPSMKPPALFTVDTGTMAATVKPTVSVIYARLQSEDLQIEYQAEKLQDWMREVEQVGIPRFGATAMRMLVFRDLLTQHFDEEACMLDELQGFFPSESPGLAEMRRHASGDHSNLLVRLDDFIERHKQLESPFASWQAAMEEFDLFFIQVEQQEDQEAESLQAMIPRK